MIFECEHSFFLKKTCELGSIPITYVNMDDLECCAYEDAANFGVVEVKKIEKNNSMR